ncbi:hypothetical protein CANARDRAFT_8165 [[Candida] arabinofermentans NRRL YB-2248]|uniref:DNA mismatch repair proteins mutS family domain-containing protein n=1 Tax=[Candida] arabinofermentans NRRL YB-2248 TaxID=983967 RepID=A0A1E4SZT3_9ASCO|nr:hypothetical protein CANARDRAFT_8165 [[Candida] arabinofermentans NRRL YB-2248]
MVIGIRYSIPNVVGRGVTIIKASTRIFQRNFSSEKTYVFQQKISDHIKIELDQIPIIRPPKKLKESKKLGGKSQVQAELEQRPEKVPVRPKKSRARKKATDQTSDITNSNSNIVEPYIDETQYEGEVYSDIGGKTSQNSLTDFYQGIKDITDHYANKGPDYVVLMQVGSFYELYFDQATKFSSMLGLTLTKKKLRTQDVAFSGFPDYRLDKYLQTIFSSGLKAVICDQKHDSVKNIIERPVDRLVTPGTVIDDGLRDFHCNNFILSMTLPEDPFKKDFTSLKIGLCWADVALGRFFVLESTLNDLMANITRINPSEILINDSVDIDSLISGRWFPELGDLRKYYITTYSAPANKKKLPDFVDRFTDNKKLVNSILESWTVKEVSAASMLLHYLDECLPTYKFNFDLPKRSLPDTIMQIDPRAAQDLELTETIRGGFKIGALANIIDRTLTDPGSRLLSTWLLAPSTDVKDIAKRQSYISVFLKDEMFVEDTISILKRTSDINRTIRRVDNGRAELSEYLELANTIFLVDELRDMTVKSSNSTLRKLVLPLFNEFVEAKILLKLAKRINRTINPKTMISKPDNYKLDTDITRRNWSVQPTATPRLQQMRADYDNLLESYDTLSTELKAQCESYGYNAAVRLIRELRTGEFVVELKSSNKSLERMIKDAKFEYKEKTKTSVKIVNPEWKTLGNQMLKLEQAITLEEMVILEDLKSSLLRSNLELSKVSPVIETLDTSISFTSLARDKNLVCPIVDKSTHFEIEEGRHLVVEEGLKGNIALIENFTANPCFLDAGESWVITGPNMGGKSTFLRQNALIAILAQIGSFVPAKSARIGVIDKIFTRVGSSDNIYRHQSTFMVEMNETAIILRDSTRRSLAIVDELGRGTSTAEGIAVAFASLSHLIKRNNSKVLFATHYGSELEKLILNDPELTGKVKFYHTSLSKIRAGNLPIDEKIVFNHHLTEGVSYHSHALEVAELAGFPNDALNVAKDSFKKLVK